MARLVVKDGHRKDAYLDEIGLCAEKIGMICVQQLTQLEESMRFSKENKHLHFDVSKLMHLNVDSKKDNH